MQNNDFRQCATGLNLWRWCKQEDFNKRNVIRGNLFEDTEQNAIQLATGTAENLIESNIITNAGKNGILVQGEKQRIEKNTVTGAKLKAIAVKGEGHTVKGNRIE